MENNDDIVHNFALVVGISIVGTLISSGSVFLLIIFFQKFFERFSRKVAADVEQSSQESWDLKDS